MNFKKFFKLGAATLVTAAFIGPGTVTTCILAGVSNGYTLLWGLSFSVIATIVLQEMAARITLAGNDTIEHVMLSFAKRRWSQIIIIALILSAIVIGNTAYETGNLLGAAIGLQMLGIWLGIEVSIIWSMAAASAIAFVLLLQGGIETVKNTLIALVLAMSIAFVIAALNTNPDWSSITSGFFRPSLPTDNSLILISIIGTTVVPYNLFLYSYLIKDQKNLQLSDFRKELFLNVGLGGLVSAAIMIAAANAGTSTIVNPSDLAMALSPTLGKGSHLLMGIGLFAAGLSSAITAPMAVSIVIGGLRQLKGGVNHPLARSAALLVLVTGSIIGLLSYKPIEMIKFAQFTNGVLLPFMAISLLWIINKRTYMKTFKNKWHHNILASIVILICTLLGMKSIFTLFI